MIACHICGYDVTKYVSVYNHTLLGDGLIVYSQKLEMQNTADKNKFKLELMKLDMLGKMITGEDQNLVEKFENKINSSGMTQGNESVLLESNFKII